MSSSSSWSPPPARPSTDVRPGRSQPPGRRVEGNPLAGSASQPPHCPDPDGCRPPGIDPRDRGARRVRRAPGTAGSRCRAATAYPSPRRLAPPSRRFNGTAISTDEGVEASPHRYAARDANRVLPASAQGRDRHHWRDRHGWRAYGQHGKARAMARSVIHSRTGASSGTGHRGIPLGGGKPTHAVGFPPPWSSSSAGHGWVGNVTG